MTHAGDDLEDRLRSSREQLEAFDGMIASAVSDVYFRNFRPDMAERFMENEPVLGWRLVDGFFDPYRAAGVYDLDRLPELAARAMDLKLQFHFASRVGLGMYNELFSETAFDPTADPFSQPGLHLQHLCLMQAQIGQVRILWDRLMSFIYYLEEGREPPGKSIRRSFFHAIPAWGGRWDVFAECEALVDKYDRRFRTPEFHKHSTLRASIFGQPINPNHIIEPVTPVMGGFWEVLTANITGAPSHVVRLARHVDPESD